MCRKCSGVCHLSKLQGCPGVLAAYPPAMDGAILNCRYIWPCNSRDVRPSPSPTKPVSSYLTFSPLPAPEAQAVVFCHISPRRRRRLSVRKRDALCCPDFPLASSRESKRQTTFLSVVYNVMFWQIIISPLQIICRSGSFLTSALRLYIS